MNDSWHSVSVILEHLHPDEDERPFNPSASSHETPMEVDHEVDVPPPASLVDVGSRAPMCKELLLKDWIVHRDRPRLIEMDQMLVTHFITILESTPKLFLERHRGNCRSRVSS